MSLNEFTPCHSMTNPFCFCVDSYSMNSGGAMNQMHLISKHLFVQKRENCIKKKPITFTIKKQINCNKVIKIWKENLEANTVWRNLFKSQKLVFKDSGCVLNLYRSV